LSYADAEGDLVKLRIKGAGSGEVSNDAGLLDLAITGTKAGSALKVSIGGDGDGRLDFRNIDVSQMINRLNLPTADVTGRVVLTGGTRSIVLGDVNSDARLLLVCSLKLG
jgi:hypothetical protein